MKLLPCIALEILVNSAFRDAQMPRKVVHRDTFHARPPEQFGGFFDDALFDHFFRKFRCKDIPKTMETKKVFKFLIITLLSIVLFRSLSVC